MQNAGGMAGDATPFEHAAGFPDWNELFQHEADGGVNKAWASLAATGGMLLMLFAYWALETYGPSSRVVFLDYLPLRDLPPRSGPGLEPGVSLVPICLAAPWV